VNSGITDVIVRMPHEAATPHVWGKGDTAACTTLHSFACTVAQQLYVLVSSTAEH
jgi:hypothetical protein